MEGLGERIRKERKTLGLTLEQLAKLVSTSKAQLQRIEKGKKSPSVALLAELSHILKKPIDALIPAERKGFYKLDGRRQKVTKTPNFEMSTISPFGLLSGDMVINHFKSNTGSLVKLHQDKGYECVYILKGTCIFDYCGIQHKLKKGDVIYYDAKKIHSVKMLSPVESIDIFIRA